jgi:O-antigen ligase
MTGEPDLLPAGRLGARPAVRSWWPAARLQRLSEDATRVEAPILLFVAFTLPLEFTKFWFPVTWLDLSRVGMLAGLAILAVHALAGTVRLRRTPLLFAVAGVVLVEVVSVALSQRPSGPKEAVAIGAYAGFAVFAAHVLSRPARHRGLALALLASAALVAAVSIAQEIGGFYVWEREGLEVLGRRNSTIGDPNITARFFAMMLAVALAGLTAVSMLRAGRANEIADRTWRGAGGRTVVAICVLIAFMAVADVLTLSRIGWLVGGLSLLLWLPMAVRHRPTLLGILVFLSVFGAYLVGNPSVIDRAGSVVGDALVRTGVVEPDDDTAPPPEFLRPPDPAASTPVDGLIERLPLDSVRRYLLRAGVAMAIDHPVLGVGVGGYPIELVAEYSGFIPSERRSAPTLLIHTDAVRIAAETGLIGIAAWLALLMAIGLAVRRGAVRRAIPIRLAALAAGTVIVVILVASQFAGRFYTEPYLWLAIGVLLAVGRSPVARRSTISGSGQRETGST